MNRNSATAIQRGIAAVDAQQTGMGLWARDGMGRQFDELSDDEAATVKSATEAEQLDAAIDAARKGQGESYETSRDRDADRPPQRHVEGDAD